MSMRTLTEYKKRISNLENENDLLRNKADYFERETFDLETKESVLVENYLEDLSKQIVDNLC